MFFAGAWFLLKNEFIQFDWTSQMMQEYAYKKAVGSDVKVLVLGDSQLEKWPMTHCLYKDLLAFFNEKDIGYINAAHHGFGPIEYKKQLEEIIPDYKPDVILLFYYAGNDLSDIIYRLDDKPKNRSYQVVFKDDEEENKKEKVGDVFKKSKSQLINYNNEFDWELFEEEGIDPKIIQYAKNRLAEPGKIGGEYVNPNILTVGLWKPNYLFDNCSFSSLSLRA